MKIVDIQVIPFRVPRTAFRNGQIFDTTIVQTLTKIITDEGAFGYYFGGRGPSQRLRKLFGWSSTYKGEV